MPAGMKTCRVCGALKPRSEFHAHNSSKDGRRGDCRACRCARQQAYARTDAGRDVQHRADKIRHMRFPQRRSARTALYRAIETGLLTPQPCIVCGAKAEAHHPDYSAPLDVVWLCRTHHMQIHKEAA